MNRHVSKWLALLAVPCMVACGGGSSGGSSAPASPVSTPGSLVFNPPLRALSLSAAVFQGTLDATTSGAQLHALATGSASLPLKCGVDVYKLIFHTTGGAAEAIESSGAMMVPTGGSGCTGPRPVLLYAHGTTTDEAYDLTQLADPANPANGESALIAAVYASNGFIVVAPNYAGYDNANLAGKGLTYHPYLNAAQQSGEMIDSLTAARAALAGVAGSGDAGLLYVSGYSQGGHVAMATVRALEAANQPVVAAATMSGPYAMEAFGDILFSGKVDIGATLFLPLITNSYQKAYSNLYTTPSDIYSANYASGIESLLPSALTQTQIFQAGLLPQSALFNSAPAAPLTAPPAGTFGFGSPFLITDAARLAYLGDAGTAPDGVFSGNANPAVAILPAASPQSTVRQALKKNDLRASLAGPAVPFWLPKAKLMMCAGGNDPVVFSVNTLIMQNYFLVGQGVLGPLSFPPHVLNIDLNADPTATAGSKLPVAAEPSTDPLFALQQAFTATFNAQAGTTAATLQAAEIAYHGTVAPFCTAASASFFAQPR